MILIHAHAQVLRDGKPGPNPKDYPYWRELLSRLRELGGEHYSNHIQIGRSEEVKIVPDFRHGLPLTRIEMLLKQCDYWIAVDSFLPHLAAHVGKPGVVLWSVSDPEIFGYPTNLNLLRDRKYLRRDQFQMWEQTPYVKEAFMPAAEVAARVAAWRTAMLR